MKRRKKVVGTKVSLEIKTLYNNIIRTYIVLLHKTNKYEYYFSQIFNDAQILELLSLFNKHGFQSTATRIASIQGTNCNNWLFHITWEKGKIDLCLK